MSAAAHSASKQATRSLRREGILPPRQSKPTESPVGPVLRDAGAQPPRGSIYEAQPLSSTQGAPNWFKVPCPSLTTHLAAQSATRDTSRSNNELDTDQAPETVQHQPRCRGGEGRAAPRGSLPGSPATWYSKRRTGQGQETRGTEGTGPWRTEVAIITNTEGLLQRTALASTSVQTRAPRSRKLC